MALVFHRLVLLMLTRCSSNVAVHQFGYHKDPRKDEPESLHAFLASLDDAATLSLASGMMRKMARNGVRNGAT